jgi:hypothetical protein
MAGLALLSAAAIISAASAADYRKKPKAAGVGFYGDQRGCYWAEGRRYCARYCYWEVDGQRYCRERPQRAHPQGNPYFVPYPPEPPIYPPFYRPR